MFTKNDKIFLKAVGVACDPVVEPFDETSRMLQDMGLPITRENYLRLECMGSPQEPDGEMESELQDAGCPAWWFGDEEE